MLPAAAATLLSQRPQPRSGLSRAPCAQRQGLHSRPVQPQWPLAPPSTGRSSPEWLQGPCPLPGLCTLLRKAALADLKISKCPACPSSPSGSHLMYIKLRIFSLFLCVPRASPTEWQCPSSGQQPSSVSCSLRAAVPLQRCACGRRRRTQGRGPQATPRRRQPSRAQGPCPTCIEDCNWDPGCVFCCCLVSKVLPVEAPLSPAPLPSPPWGRPRRC